jgi:hypothetical protein
VTTNPDNSSKTPLLPAVMVWALMFGTAGIEISLLAPLAGHGTDLADEISYYSAWITIEMFWIWCLLMEWANRYDRRKARGARKMGVLTQALLVSINLLDGLKNLPVAGIALYFAGVAGLLWHGWMRAIRLHPEDQKVINQLIKEEAELLAQTQLEDARRARETKLQAAITYVSKRTTAAPATGATDEEPPRATWTIPRGQHAPVVYFIRNGNRIKIGTTTDLYQRVRRLALRTDHVALILPGSRDTERSLHRRFAALRVGNTEWFRDQAPLSDFITTQNELAQTKKEV